MVEYINYEGKKLPVRIKYYALANFKKDTGASFDEMQAAAAKAKETGGNLELQLDEFEMMGILLYYSLISGLKAIDPKAKFQYEKEDMFNILEECFIEFSELFPKFFPDVETGAEVDGKKYQGNRQQKRKNLKKTSQKIIR
jgi:hypothetical protein